LFGFRVGEVVRFDRGGTWPRATSRVIGPGTRAQSIALSPVDLAIDRTGGPDVDLWDLRHDTPAFHTLVELEPRIEMDRHHGGSQPLRPSLRHATEALIADNPHLLIPRVSWEGGRPHSRAGCLRADLVMREAGSAARLEAVLPTVTDPDVLDCVQSWSARMARSTDMETPWLDDEDKAILQRVASFTAAWE